MPTIRRRRTILALACAATALLPTAACQNPKFKEKQAVRDERIEALGDDYVKTEQSRLVRIQAVADLHKTLEAKRVTGLNQTLKQGAEFEKRRAKDWAEQAPVRHERVRSIFGGKPETIPNSWSDIVY